MISTETAPAKIERQHWMAVLARADRAAMEDCLADAPALPAHVCLRGPETGLVMVRGRAGGGGAAFNFGEMTVTRCTVRAEGRIGHAYVAGRNADKAELAARLDAALQDSARYAALQALVIEPLAAMEAVRRSGLAARAAATRVEFFHAGDDALMSLDLPGFADPVAQSQATFRAVLDAMARPGRLHIVGDKVQPPAPLTGATAALLLTLADADTPLWASPDCAAARDWISFHCGAPFTDSRVEAAFAVATALPDLTAFSAGSDEAPEESATLVVQVAGFGAGQWLRLSGPGLRTPAILQVDGLPPDFATTWAANHALYPRGVDIVLVAGNALVALPRSVRVEAG